MTHPFTVEDGHLLLPERPGLGSDLIEVELHKHPPASYPGAR
jgi:L-alanine-DL-glutamate epimerase-like enolase superfamily enzyme